MPQLMQPCSMQYHAIPCNTMQNHAKPCNTMQYHAIPCNTMQYHGTLITADGAYHCPVGSIMAIFSSVRSSYSHPDLLVTQHQHHPLFQITPVLNNNIGVSLSEPSRDDLGTILHYIALSCLSMPEYARVCQSMPE